MKETSSSNKLSKLNLLRNLSKINKTQDHSPENLKDEIYNKGIGNVMKTANFMKSRGEGNLKKYKISSNNSPRTSEGWRSFIKSKTNTPNFAKGEDQNERLNEFFKVYYKERPKSSSKLSSRILNEQVNPNKIKSNNASISKSKASLKVVRDGKDGKII